MVLKIDDRHRQSTITSTADFNKIACYFLVLTHFFSLCSAVYSPYFFAFELTGFFKSSSISYKITTKQLYVVASQPATSDISK